MFARFYRSLIILSLIVGISIPVFADPAGTTQGVTTGPRRQLATIIFAGLGGAVIGLSTLSFYGRPQDYLSNIAVGFAVGIIIGTAVVTFKAAASPADFYGAPAAPGAQYFPSVRDRDFAFSQAPAPTLQLNWKF